MEPIILKGQPISTNNCYYHAGKGVTFLKPKAKVLKEDYKWQLKSQWKKKPIEGELEIDIKIYFGTKRDGDWDNFHKLSMDAMNSFVWKDDRQIKKATVEKFYDKDNPRLEIRVELSPPIIN